MKASTVASTASVKSAGTSRLYDVPSLEDDGTNFQMWKFHVWMVLGVRGLWKVVTGDEAQPDEVTHPAEHEDWLSKDREALAQITLTLKDEPLSGVLYTTTSAEAWKKLSERYEGKGKQSIAYLISELFRNTLSDDESMETQLNSMRQKANVLKTLGQPLEDSLVAIAMVISLPPTYSTLWTILMAADDKLTTDAVINQVLIEEKSRKVSSTHSALAAKTTGRSKQKGRGKVSKEEKGKRSCTYCSKSGHTEDECWAKKAAERSKEKDDMSKEQADEKELAAHVAKTGSTHLPPLHLFLARQTSAPIQRDWAVDSTVSTHTACHERDPFDSHRPPWPPHLTSPSNGKTVSVPDAGDTLNRAPIPSIAGDSTLREKFTKPELNKPKSNSFDGENRRLAIASTNGLSHVAVDGIYLNADETEGLACGIGQQSVKRRLNSPGGPRTPTSTLEVSVGPTTRAPGWRHQQEAVNGSVNASDRSDRGGLRHLGNSTPKLEFGGKEIETDVRSDEKRMNDDGLTYQRVQSRLRDPLTRNVPPIGRMDDLRAPMGAENSDRVTTQAPGLKRQEDAVNRLVKPSAASDRDGSRHQGDSNPKLEFGGEMIETEVRKDGNQMDGHGRTSQRALSRPLDPLTRNVPPTGETDDLRGPTCGQNGYLCNNDLETCKDRDKRTVKEGKGQPSTKGIRDSPRAVETDSNKSCNVDYSNAKAATESCDSALTANAQRGTTTKGLTAVCNASDCHDLRSMAAPNKICHFPGHPFGETDDPCDYNKIETDDPPTPPTTKAHTTAH